MWKKKTASSKKQSFFSNVIMNQNRKTIQKELVSNLRQQFENQLDKLSKRKRINFSETTL